MKYIIEIAKEYEEYFKGILICGIADGKFAVDVIAREDLEELTSDYINEHYGSLQDEAYKRGINDGSLDVKQRVEGAYQQGLEDAWECAKKLFSTMSDTEIEKVFPVEWKSGFSGLMQMKPQYAIAKLKAYEEKQKEEAEDEIKVGDEVKPFYTDITGVATLIDGDTIYVLWRDGSSTSTVKLKEVTKTGRHFDIASILEDMRND